MSTPPIVLGTMTFGWASASAKVGDDEALAQCLEFARTMKADYPDNRVIEIDTAAVYSVGESERIIGRILPRVREVVEGELGLTLELSTKANPWPSGSHYGSAEGFRPERFEEQVRASLERLQVTSFDRLYLHGPDNKVELQPTVDRAQQLHHAGIFRELAASNYAAWEVVELDRCCDRWEAANPGKTAARLKVIQMMYNALTRQVEPELVPVCRRLNIRMYAYNALAAGLLSPKGERAAEAEDMKESVSAAAGRFHGNDSYTSRFLRPSVLEAVRKVRSALPTTPLLQVAYDWLCASPSCQLRLGPSDAILVGFSTQRQLTEGMTALRVALAAGRASEAADACTVVDNVFAGGVQGSEACYFRGFSAQESWLK